MLIEKVNKSVKKEVKTKKVKKTQTVYYEKYNIDKLLIFSL